MQDSKTVSLLATRTVANRWIVSSAVCVLLVKYNWIDENKKSWFTAAQRCCKRTEFSSLKTSWSAVVASPNSCSWWKRSPRAPDVSCTELDPVSVSLQTFKILDLEEHAKEKLRLSDNLIVVAWTISVNTRKSVDSLLELTLISSNVFPFVSISSCSTSTFCGSEKVTKETSSNMLSPFGNLCDQSRNAWHGFSWRGSSDWRTVRAWSPGVRAPKIHNRSTDACSWTTDTSISSENATIGTKFADLYLTLSSTFHQWWRLRSRNDREPCINIIVTKKTSVDPAVPLAVMMTTKSFDFVMVVALLLIITRDAPLSTMNCRSSLWKFNRDERTSSGVVPFGGPKKCLPSLQQIPCTLQYSA